MLRKQHLFTIAIITTVILFTAMDAGLAQGRAGGHRGGRERGLQHAPFWSELTAEQQTELQELIQTMRDDGASREEIRDAIHAQFKDWVVDLPEPPNVIDWLGDQLTDAQKTELEALIQTMKNDEASRDEIREAVNNQLVEWGIDLPALNGYPRFRGFGDQLTDAQCDELHAMVQQMHEEGASRQEIHEAVRDKLNEWGIDLPEGRGPRSERSEKGNHRQLSRKIRGINHPNPFNPETTITYDLQQPGNVTLSIYNTQGQLVRSLDVGHQQTGPFQIKWNGKSDAGVTVPSGMYVYKIQAGSEEFTGRMLMMK